MTGSGADENKKGETKIINNMANLIWEGSCLIEKTKQIQIEDLRKDN